jgi:hypothetical protein
MTENYADVQYLCLHAMEHLPDSTRLRRRVLIGIVEVLHRNDPVVHSALKMLTHLDAVEKGQRNLPLELRKRDGE